MKLNIRGADNETKGTVDVPHVFHELVRVDLVKRAFLATVSKERQAYGSDPRAGKKHSVTLHKRRRKYRGSYGKGISRSPRKIMSRRGVQFNWTGANAPNTVGGARAHPPKANRRWEQKLNTKERKKALRSALAATLDKTLVAQRCHALPDTYPFVLANDIAQIKTTKEVRAALTKLQLDKELARADATKIRKGKATLRGRVRKRKTGPLIVVDKLCPLSYAARNLPGVDVVLVKRLNVKALAPGAHLARLTLFTEDALKHIEKEGLFQ